ncbi:MAG: TRAM domain-containing protein [Candidatus Thermoplasmatota archaeon]
MSGRIDTAVVKKRSKNFSRIIQDMNLEKNKEEIGKEHEVLILKKRKNISYLGRTENYKIVIIYDDLKKGYFYPVKITGMEKNFLTGNIK